jgi:uncharacterized protein YndB with AHSA1/START domain
MPVRKDDSGRRWVEMEVLVPGTPEQVWHAIATGAGTSAWFTPTTVEEKVGGRIEFEFGEGVTQHATVTGWDPPHRFTYEEQEWSGTVSPGPLATEITVTARSGDRCVIRMVHSLFTEKDDWDDELESFEQGWPGFFEVLRLYLKDFAGAPSAPAYATVAVDGDIVAAWPKLASALGLSGVHAGQRCQSADGAPELAGTVELIEQRATVRYMIIRMDRPAAGIAVVGGFATGDTSRAMVTVHFYGDGAVETAGEQEPRWTAWLTDLFGAHAVAT